MSMFGHERRQSIVARARRDGRVNVAELATELDVTAETVRRDLSELEQSGLLRRVHGGAVPVDQLTLEPEVLERSAAMMAQKRRIAKRALEELSPEGTVLLDSGTTTAAIADRFPTDRPRSVVTNSVSLALVLASRPNLTVLTLGGQIRSATHAAVGPWALQQLATVQPDIAFIATNGVSVERGLTTPNSDEAAVKRQIVRSAKRRILVADHTKVGREFFERFAELDDIDLFICDAGLDAGVHRALLDAGLETVLA
jgi:DeoR family transcriptional regulator, fructose operon transcriptional repressor